MGVAAHTVRVHVLVAGGVVMAVLARGEPLVPLVTELHRLVQIGQAVDPDRRRRIVDIQGFLAKARAARMQCPGQHHYRGRYHGSGAGLH
jgi:hypothetical protein